MKVLCIDQSNQHKCVCCNADPGYVKEGETYVVRGIYEDCYFLYGKETCQNCDGSYLAFYKRRFIPVSDIDEADILEKRKKTTHNGKSN